ncbi:MAG TPA: hypothetical protein VGD46_19565 [Rhizobacter sp.]
MPAKKKPAELPAAEGAVLPKVVPLKKAAPAKVTAKKAPAKKKPAEPAPTPAAEPAVPATYGIHLCALSALKPTYQCEPASYGWLTWVRETKRICNATPGLIRKALWWGKVYKLDPEQTFVRFSEQLEDGKPTCAIDIINATGLLKARLLPELPNGTARIERGSDADHHEAYTNWSEAKMAIKAALKAPATAAVEEV